MYIGSEEVKRIIDVDDTALIFYDEEENPIIETKELIFKIEEYEDKRIVKVKVCKNEPEETEK